ncbi:MAG TPA: hypothetical protein VFE24_04510 [Pirellulales bacterium]|jgi:hypothetical protein|nr:hypothetical protein [Pirellulales bacterium]
MKGFLYVVLFTLLTALCWGVYGPALQTGQLALRESILDPPVPWRAFICVGIAYFLIAVLVPLVWLKLSGEKGGWTTPGFIWSFIAGAAGAIGALGIILAFTNRGNPVYVMPLVFGIAPVVNTFTTMYMSKTFKDVGPIFLAGLILVVVGAVTVLFTKPNPVRPVVKDLHETPDGKISFTLVKKDGADEKVISEISGYTLAELEQKEKPAAAAYLASKRGPITARNWAVIIFSILLTGVTWGVYGPTLHKGQIAMNGSRLRPFICVGLAYLAIAVIVPFALLGSIEPNASFNLPGTSWSLIAGAAGAIGAIGIIMAFNLGGKPIFVMPLVFGLAPVINSFVELFRSNLVHEIGPLFYAGLLLVIAGAVTVLLFAPRAKPHALEPAKH